MFKVGGSTNFSSLNQNVFQSLDLFAQRLNAVNGRKVQNSSKNLNVAEDKKSGCTLTYGEYIQIGGRVASPVYYVAPIINLKGSGKLILEVAPDLPDRKSVV